MEGGAHGPFAATFWWFPSLLSTRICPRPVFDQDGNRGDHVDEKKGKGLAPRMRRPQSLRNLLLALLHPHALVSARGEGKKGAPTEDSDDE